MTALVTKHLPFIAGAPNGIDSLRGLILELAIQGRLIKRELNAPSWRRLKLPEVAAYRIGKTPPSKEARHWDDKGIPWVSISDIEHFTVLTETSRSVSREMVPETFKYPPVPAGSLLMSFKLTVGKICVLGVDAYHNEAIISLQPKEGVLRDYLMRVLPSIAKSGNTKDALMGATLNSASLAELTIPVPPPEEQASIVAKVDELMALCDRLEADQADAEAAHAQLVQALLDSLTQATDAADFRASWQRLSEHFHTLFTTEASIDALKQTVLQLAVMGKLVPQSRDDEPASALLRRADLDKARLIAEGSVRKERGSTAKQSVQGEPFSLPPGWLWVKKSSVLQFLNGYAFKSEWFRPDGVALLRNINVGHGVVNWSDVACLTEEQADEFAAFALEAGDLVLSLDRPIISTGLKAAVIRESDLPCLLLQRVAKLSPFAGSVATGYLTIWLNSAFFIGAIDPGRSNGVPHISTSQVGEMLFALPPLAEQHRIVAKVDELMALCDRLKAALTESRQLHGQLATALIEQAVA